MIKKDFYFDSLTNFSKTYDEFLVDINNSLDSFTNVLDEKEIYNVFIRIVQAIFLEETLILLDNNYSKTERQNLISTLESKYLNCEIKKDKRNKRIDKSVFIFDNLLLNKSKFGFFTSGTTGVPRCFFHNIQNLIRNIKVNQKQNNAVWGFAYNPTHIAGCQVFLQGVFNLNSLINIFNHTRDDVIHDINFKKITQISASPTFYRTRFSNCDVFEKVIRISCGGEVLTTNDCNNLKLIFPNAKITNIYASTELATVLISEDNVFRIPEKFINFVRILDNELWFHKDLFGEHSEKSENLNINESWIASGDCIEIVSQDSLTFKIIRRKGDIINSGGYSINSIEVSDTLRKHSCVQDAFVYPISNSVMGQIVAAKVVIKNNFQTTERDLIDFLLENLQTYKIPRIIDFVDQLDVSSTGKARIFPYEKNK